ncbi:hypothetical protein LIER_01689 [Lithospermum erythrorhizon]|uniref:Uncharacterized protein n=1 Tax=Lithospermum erythrorhizon TaxID=34254 RepID=A0AAV3NMU4_LITER
MGEEHETTPKIRRRRSLINISCCFSGSETFDLSPSYTPSSKWNLILPTCISPQHENGPNDLQEQVMKKYRSFISRNKGIARRQRASSDFSYDPLSYSLNFEDDTRVDLYSGEFKDDAIRRDFSSRLPISPPPRCITKSKSIDDLERIGSTLGDAMTPPKDKSLLRKPCEVNAALRTHSIEKYASNESSLNKSALRKPSEEMSALGTHSIEKHASNEPSINKYALRNPSEEKPALRTHSIEKSSSTEPFINKSALRNSSEENSALRMHSIEKSASKEPSIDKSVFREPSIDKSALREPSDEKSSLRTHSIENSTSKERSISKSALRKPSTDKSATLRTSSRGKSELRPPSIYKSASRQPSTDKSSLIDKSALRAAAVAEVRKTLEDDQEIMPASSTTDTRYSRRELFI